MQELGSLDAHKTVTVDQSEPLDNVAGELQRAQRCVVAAANVRVVLDQSSDEEGVHAREEALQAAVIVGNPEDRVARRLLDLGPSLVANNDV